MNEIITDIVKLVAAAAVIMITKYVIPCLKSKIEKTEYDWIVDAVKTGVQSAEQTITGSGLGGEKKRTVMNLVNEMAESKDIQIATAQLDAMIESAVYAMKQSKEE